VSAEEADPRAVLRALGIDDLNSVEPVSGGWDTAIFRVERPGGVHALRVYRVGQDETCRREIAAMRAARAAGIPVPDVHARGSWNGRPALLLSWCPGRTMAEALGARPWRAWYLGVVFGRMHAAINRVPAPADLETGADTWIAWLAPGEEALRACVERTAHCSDALLHLDYHLLNVLTDGTRITAVLDWANAHAGDPRADYARTLSILRLDSEPPQDIGVPRWAVRLVVRLFALGWRRGYGRVPGDLAPYEALVGVYLERSLTPRLGVPSGLTPGRLARIRRWTAERRRRAGCP
jgi:aminoglycoside phosphotransferase (APT) family kinase protein